VKLDLQDVHVDLLEHLVALRCYISQHGQLEVFLNLLNHSLCQVNAVLELLVQDERCQVLLDDFNLLTEFGSNLVERNDFVCLNVVDESLPPDDLEDLLAGNVRAEDRIVCQLTPTAAEIGGELLVVSIAEILNDA
jgi:hypothetical protein